MENFIPGLELNRLFYHDFIKPVLSSAFPSLSYSAALIGYGSDVLGYDTMISADHNWGPRLQLFLTEDDVSKHKNDIHECLSNKLPRAYKGYDVLFQKDNITSISSFIHSYLGIPIDEPLSMTDWLSFPEQALLEITEGEVYYDGLGQLNTIREKLSYFPKDVWLYRLASQWARISQEEAFMGRCGDVGDELGSRIIAARLVRDLMKLCFLMERQYAPYHKWFGTAFSKLQCAPQLTIIFNRVLEATNWKEREIPLCEAYEYTAKMHNSLKITEPLDIHVTDYYGRPYKVLFAERFHHAIKNTISDKIIKNIPISIGAVDQFVDCTDLTQSFQRDKRKLLIMYNQ